MRSLERNQDQSLRVPYNRIVFRLFLFLVRVSRNLAGSGRVELWVSIYYLECHLHNQHQPNIKKYSSKVRKGAGLRGSLWVDCCGSVILSYHESFTTSDWFPCFNLSCWWKVLQCCFVGTRIHKTNSKIFDFSSKSVTEKVQE